MLRQARDGSDGSLAGDERWGLRIFFPVVGELLSFGEENAYPKWKAQQTLPTETMTFARQTGIAVFLVTLTLWIQCAGIAVLIRWARVSIERGVAGLSSLQAAILMIRFSTLMVVMHFLQIFFWSVFYRWYCLPSWESSFYFSATSYSTVGYGDVVLPRVWRLLGPVESVTGVLMCGISVSCLFAVATRLVERESGAPTMRYINGLDGRSEAQLEKVS
jgi:voltage-gated potassium channel